MTIMHIKKSFFFTACLVLLTQSPVLATEADDAESATVKQKTSDFTNDFYQNIGKLKQALVQTSIKFSIRDRVIDHKLNNTSAIVTQGKSKSKDTQIGYYLNQYMSIRNLYVKNALDFFQMNLLTELFQESLKVYNDLGVEMFGRRFAAETRLNRNVAGLLEDQRDGIKDKEYEGIIGKLPEDFNTEGKTLLKFLLRFVKGEDAPDDIKTEVDGLTDQYAAFQEVFDTLISKDVYQLPKNADRRDKAIMKQITNELKLNFIPFMMEIDTKDESGKCKTAESIAQAMFEEAKEKFEAAQRAFKNSGVYNKAGRFKALRVSSYLTIKDEAETPAVDETKKENATTATDTK